MVFVRRLVAEFIDLFILIGSVAVGIYFGAQLSKMFEEPFFLLTISQVCIIILIPILLQSLFWLESTTIGKMMTFSKVVENKNSKDLDYFTMLVREFLLKVLSCYFVCLPVFIGKPGIHEIITDSCVIIKPKEKRGTYKDEEVFG